MEKGDPAKTTGAEELREAGGKDTGTGKAGSRKKSIGDLE